MGLGWLAVMLTFANFVLLSFAFSDQLTVPQFETVYTFAEVASIYCSDSR